MSDDIKKHNKKHVSDLREEKMRIASSVPGLNDKIQTKLEGSLQKIYWYIKFNLELDENFVSKKTMNVTDIRGYILKTEINYDISKNCIAIYPVDSYESDQFYLLNISKKVRSKAGANLKKEIHILFKLVNNKVEDFQVLKNSQTVAKPRKRPKNYEEKFMNSAKIVRNPPVGKVYSFDKSKVEKDNDTGKLIMQPIRINVIIGIIGLILSAISLFLEITPAIIVSLLIEAIGIVHIIIQLLSKRCRSIIAYNRGVRFFNAERYNAASIYFDKALMLDSNNEVAEYAYNKTKFYT